MCAYVSGREAIASPQCTARSISGVRGVRDHHVSYAESRAQRKLPASKPLYDMKQDFWFKFVF